MNSLKDLYLLLEEENLASPSHQTDKRSAADEQPTIKVGRERLSGTQTRRHTLTGAACLLAVEGGEQHSGRPEGGTARSERRAATGAARLPGAHPAVRKSQGIMGSGENWTQEPHNTGRRALCSGMSWNMSILHSSFILSYVTNICCNKFKNV